jgi:hypothetical protein
MIWIADETNSRKESSVAVRALAELVLAGLRTDQSKFSHEEKTPHERKVSAETD